MKHVDKSVSPALQNGLNIVELLARVSSGVGFNDIAREIEVSKSTTSRLLSVLRSRRYVVKRMDGKYAPGPRMSLLNHSIPLLDRLRLALPDILDSLMDASHNTCLFIFWTGREMQCLDKRTHQGSVPMQEIGHVDRDLTGGPWGLLFYDSLAGDALAAAEQNIKRDVDWRPIFTRWLEFYQRNGFCYDDQELYGPLRRLAAPVRDTEGELIGVIAVGGNSLTIENDQVPHLGETLKVHAAKLAESL
ncbi:MAG: helix-turn-helix domain-containing protein [Victivallales bacterium]|nr:helix-turn-helix domain-containing protein [Victivallales bacterium]